MLTSTRGKGIFTPCSLKRFHSRLSTSDFIPPTPLSGSLIHTNISCSTLLSPNSLSQTLGFGERNTRGDSVAARSEEHTSELQSLMRISYAVFCLKKTQPDTTHEHKHTSDPHTPITN